MLPAMAIAMRWDEGSLRGTTRLKTRRGAFSPLFAPDIGGGPSGIGRGSAKTGDAPKPWPPLQPKGRLSCHGWMGREFPRAFPAARAGNGGILPQIGAVCNHEKRPARGARGAQTVEKPLLGGSEGPQAL